MDNKSNKINLQDKLKILLQENQFIIPSFNIYGGFLGFHDYGVLGVQIKNKILNIWRKMFLHEDDIDEIETSIITPYDVFEQSGHVNKFTDFIVYDADKKCYRADHLLKEYYQKNGMYDMISQVDSWLPKKMEYEINKNKIILGPFSKENPNRRLSVKILKRNLMYEVAPSTMIDSDNVDFLRPELAQGIFVNFKTIQQQMNKKLPFGLAQIGKSFRKEISPYPFTRMREFSQAEIEYFIDPKRKEHMKFKKIKNYKIPIQTASMQLNKENPIIISIEEAINKGFINSETMGYYLARIHMFAKELGLNLNKIKFRQHLPEEMAHYANNCYDLEVLVFDKWLECIGCADRGDYDLKAHGKNTNLKIKRKLDKDAVPKILIPILNVPLLKEKFNKNFVEIIKYFKSMNHDELRDVKDVYFKDKDEILISINSNIFVISKDMISIREEVNQKYEEYYPHVIEPSFGIDRLIYSIFSHNIWEREDDAKRLVLSLPQKLVPYDIAVFQLYNKEEMINIVDEIVTILKNEGYRCYRDDSSVSIGKRYARLDELGVKYAITVDPGTVKDGIITIRDRDSMKQKSINKDNLIGSGEYILNKVYNIFL